MNNLNDVFLQTLDYCNRNDYRGWDPYDGLNSKVFQKTPLYSSALLRMMWIQFFKQSPINLRKLMLVNVGDNPKGIALIITALCNYYWYLQQFKLQDNEKWDQKSLLNEIVNLVDRLLKIRSPGYKNYCWGYNFPWQSRAFFLPKWCPTVVVTSFVVDALIRVYEINKDSNLLDVVSSSTRFITKDLNKIENSKGVGYSYSPLDNRLVFNATLLGSRLLANVYKYTHDSELLNHAKCSIESTLEAFNDDGSIDHSLQVKKAWRDSFHTGFKLESIARYQKYTGDTEYQRYLDEGYRYWRNSFFKDNGQCDYYDNSEYPLDIHCPGQYFPTVYYVDKSNESQSQSDRVYEWMINTFYSTRLGYFIFQKKERYTIRIPYMRWGQCWALYGLSFYLLISSRGKHDSTSERAC